MYVRQFLILGTCQQIQYVVQSKTRHCKSFRQNCSALKELWISLVSNNVLYCTTVLQVDFNCFVSSIGGNLGLFLGFSILSSLFSIYACFSRQKLQNWKSKLLIQGQTSKSHIVNVRETDLTACP